MRFGVAHRIPDVRGLLGKAKAPSSSSACVWIFASNVAPIDTKQEFPQTNCVAIHFTCVAACRWCTTTVSAECVSPHRGCFSCVVHVGDEWRNRRRKREVHQNHANNILIELCMQMLQGDVVVVERRRLESLPALWAPFMHKHLWNVHAVPSLHGNSIVFLPKACTLHLRMHFKLKITHYIHPLVVYSLNTHTHNIHRKFSLAFNEQHATKHRLLGRVEICITLMDFHCILPFQGAAKPILERIIFSFRLILSGC